VLPVCVVHKSFSPAVLRVEYAQLPKPWHCRLIEGIPRGMPRVQLVRVPPASLGLHLCSTWGVVVVPVGESVLTVCLVRYLGCHGRLQGLTILESSRPRATRFTWQPGEMVWRWVRDAGHVAEWYGPGQSGLEQARLLVCTHIRRLPQLTVVVPCMTSINPSHVGGFGIDCQCGIATPNYESQC